MASPEHESQPIRAQLGLFDAVSIIIGIVIGSTIYKSPQLIMNNVSGPGMGLWAWTLGGILSLIGALCYAELASTYPRTGGDYVYLTRAFGPWAGFLFGWAQLAVILTGSIGAMAFVFGDYAAALWKPEGTGAERERLAATFAVLAVAVLSLMNILGVVLGKWTQNVLSLLKVLGLGSIVVAGFLYGRPDAFQVADPPNPDKISFGLAMIFVLYAYGGWNDAAFVAAEVRDRRNIVRALLLGVGVIMVIYLTVNVAYLLALGFDGVRKSGTVAADVGRLALGENGSLAISVLVMVSALGAINGLIFTGSRLYSALGAENSVFALLGKWHPTLGSPLWALLIQAAISLAMIAGVGTQAGRDAIDWAITRVPYLGLRPMPWERYFGGFDTLVAGTAPVFWAFFLMSGLSLFVLRQRDPGIARPFTVPLYPEVPLIFCATCFYMLYSAIDYAKYITLIGVIPLLIGLPLYHVSRRRAAE